MPNEEDEASGSERIVPHTPPSMRRRASPDEYVGAEEA